jgi:hypothetical protein
MTAGHIYAIAGGGRLTGNGIPATTASIKARGVTHDGAGNVVIGDGPRLRVVAARTGRFYGQAMKAGDIYTVAGTGWSGLHASGDGGPAARARIFATFVAVDGAGNLAFADSDSGTIRVVAARSGTFYGIPMKAGHIYSISASGYSGPGSGPGSGTATASGSGGAAASMPLPGQPAGVAADPSGDLIIGFIAYYDSAPAFVPARAGTYFGVRMRPGRRYAIPTAGGPGARRGGGGPFRQRPDRRPGQEPRPRGTGALRHVLRPADDHGPDLRRGRRREAGRRGRRRPRPRRRVQPL